MPLSMPVLLQSVISESSLLSLSVAVAVVLAAWRVAVVVTSIRADLKQVVEEASRANTAIDRMTNEQGQLRREFEHLASKVGAMLQDHAPKSSVRLWIMRLRVSNPELNVPDFHEE